MSEFISEDWTKFRSLGELPRAAGVTVSELPKLVAKELVDNALDAVAGAADMCRAGVTHEGSFWVEDDGTGIDGTPDEIGALFSFARPLTSSKKLRLPTRGALGNGLRVVAGYAFATGGSLCVHTHGKSMELTPENDGGTRVEVFGGCSIKGTRVEVSGGAGREFKQQDLSWAKRALSMTGAKTYTGATSPHWFDTDSFWELCQAFSGSIRELVTRFDGCQNPKAGRLTMPWKGKQSKQLSRVDAEDLLGAMRAEAKPFNVKRLGEIGPGLLSGYAKEIGQSNLTCSSSALEAKLPFVVEVWAQTGQSDGVQINVNRTPVTADVRSWRGSAKTEIAITGCGLSDYFKVGSKRCQLIINVQTPYMPITSDGKAPNLAPMFRQIKEAIERAAKSASRQHLVANPEAKRRPETEIVRDCLDLAIAKASGDGASRYSLRQLYYQVRPFILNELGKEPTYDNFSNIITAIEGERGSDLPGIYRDTRGTLYHPHTREEISLGTLTVEKYERPSWTFNKILYCEKEGFFALLKDAQWPERHDCALVTAKGQPTRAARDILDLLGDSEQELTFFCIHDADAAGTIIYQSLQEETKARAARRVKIINLGLEPEEAIEMQLPLEKIEVLKKGRPVASYVEDDWARWLQGNRAELNAMTSPQFIQWLDGKMEDHNGAKLVPPVDVLLDQLEAATRDKIKNELTAQIIKEAKIEERVNDAFSNLNGELIQAREQVEGITRDVLKLHSEQTWKQPVEEMAMELSRKATE